MARPPKWNSPTTAARFPAHAMPMLEALARQLDALEGNVQNPPLLFSVGETRYLLRDDGNPDPAIDAAVDRAWAELVKLSPDERWWVLARLVEAWGTPIGGDDHA